VTLERSLPSRWKGGGRFIRGTSFDDLSNPLAVVLQPVTGRVSPCEYETSRLPHFLDSGLEDGGEAVRLRAGCTLLPGIFLVLISVRARVEQRALGLGKGKGKNGKVVSLFN
jgi:hypothetical protein